MVGNEEVEGRNGGRAVEGVDELMVDEEQVDGALVNVVGKVVGGGGSV